MKMLMPRRRAAKPRSAAGSQTRPVPPEHPAAGLTTRRRQDGLLQRLLRPSMRSSPNFGSA
jgi:hypothetical protein